MIRRLLLVGALVLAPMTARAAATVVSAGPRFGLSVSPDQVVFGGQLGVRGADPDWSFDPSLDIGFGDNEETIAPSFDALYHFHLRDSDWRPYAGGGLTLTFVSENRDFPLRDRSHTDVGLSGIVGLTIPTTHGPQWFTELRLGIGDVASLKVMGGLNFRM